MKKIMIILIAILLAGCVWAQDNPTETINGVGFEIPEKYQGGNLTGDKYEFKDKFSIQCIDNSIPQHIGLWASESDYKKDINIKDHPVRHYYQYLPYVKDNRSHAYFASGNSIYEIVWTGSKITKDIEKTIKNSPPSNISDKAFKNKLDKSIKTYKQEKIDRMNKDSQYTYLKAKYFTNANSDNQDDARLNEILLTYYR